ncbi:MAG TPA: hypothetical protein VIS72_10050 [Anaerolineales bacterium]
MNQLRVSVATYDQVIFPHPESGITMLALERKATVLKDGNINVRAQPFGGGVKILNTKSLKEIVGEIQFDSERSKQEQDFRILIQPSQWEMVKGYCLQHLTHPDDPELESAPDRELVEEFEETMGVALKRSQYKVEPMGFVVEDNPAQTDNWYARGFPTVRVYRTYKVNLIDAELCKNLLDTSGHVSDEELGRYALKNERGRANTVLALPLNSVSEACFVLPPEARYKKIKVDGYELDESVLVVLGDVDVPQYQRL